VGRTLRRLLRGGPSPPRSPSLRASSRARRSLRGPRCGPKAAQPRGEAHLLAHSSSPPACWCGLVLNAVLSPLLGGPHVVRSDNTEAHLEQVWLGIIRMPPALRTLEVNSVSEWPPRISILSWAPASFGPCRDPSLDWGTTSCISGPHDHALRRVCARPVSAPRHQQLPPSATAPRRPRLLVLYRLVATPLARRCAARFLWRSRCRGSTVVQSDDCLWICGENFYLDKRFKHGSFAAQVLLVSSKSEGRFFLERKATPPLHILALPLLKLDTAFFKPEKRFDHKGAVRCEQLLNCLQSPNSIISTQRTDFRWISFLPRRTWMN